MRRTLDADSLGKQPESDERILREAFRSGLDLSRGDAVLTAAVNHVLEHEGSMVRARACFVAARVAGLGRAEALDLAVAVEYFHTASLIFDDLPAMDDAEERRHAPCVHRLFGEGAAVLAGLAFVNRAYTLLWRGMEAGEPANRKRAMAYADRCLGMTGLLSGQSRDLHGANLALSEREVTEVAFLKTVPLLRLAVVLPLIVAGGDARLRQLLERYCAFRGLAYQIADDLIDVVSSASDSGKTPNRDAFQGRPNMALLVGVEGARRRVERLNALGDRTMAALPGGISRWGYLNAMRPALRPAWEGLDLSMASAAV